MSSPTTPCPCGQAAIPVGARFCHQCGRTVAPPTCTACGATRSPGARFCHRCGAAAAPAPAAPAPGAGQAPGAASAPTARTPWLVAGLLCIVVIAGTLFNLMQKNRAPAAAAPPPGAAEAPFAGGGGPGGPAPDISNLSPRERFDRLFDRVMRAASTGDSTTVTRFTPMAVAAYGMLDTVDVDARFHAAVLHAQVGAFREAKALADTILASAPGHLFGYLVLGDVARLSGDARGLARARAEFRRRYDAELATNKLEYLDHKPALDEFKAQADSAR